MRKKRDALGVGEHSDLATETIDQSLDRLARQDTRLNPIESQEPARSFGPSGKQAVGFVLPLVRWAIILGVTWFIWRAFTGRL